MYTFFSYLVGSVSRKFDSECLRNRILLKHYSFYLGLNFNLFLKITEKILKKIFFYYSLKIPCGTAGTTRFLVVVVRGTVF